MSTETKKLVDSVRKVVLLRATTIARFVPGENPSGQTNVDVEKGETLEIGLGIAQSLVRAKYAHFANPKEQESFENSEALRLESGQYINDRERDQMLRLQGVPVGVQVQG